MNDLSDSLDWIFKAENDFKLARLALGEKPPITDGGCFHLQQCAEKYLKAILVAHNKFFPKTHDLVQLSVLCEAAGVIVPVDTDQLELLANHAIKTRYPRGIPPVEDARQAMKTARAVRKFARKFLNVK
ncbi:MAG: HEPN domain-containing protein [Chloroflexi bacterium]|nr:HEPN domain-containing protein [Chloroflexota bacterium]